MREGVVIFFSSDNDLPLFFTTSTMNLEDQRLKFINASMETIHNLCDELYESLVDQEFHRVDPTIKEIIEILQDLNQTFQDEI